MQIQDYFEFIVNQIHTTVVATTDDGGLPVTCAVDMMDYDEEGLYFLTAQGKNLYSRLKSRGYLALTGVKGVDTMSSVSVSVRGKVRELGADRLQRLFDKNPYMYELYPDRKAQSVIRIFQIYEGCGDWFDLSRKPVDKARFVFGKEAE